MKFQSQHDVIDPEVSLKTGFEYDGDDDPDAQGDAYVIGEDMDSIQAPPGSASPELQTGPKPWVKPAAVALSIVFVVLAAWNMTRVAMGPPPPPKLSPFQVKQALYLGVMKVDAYRRLNGVTPDSLTEAGLPDPGPYVYERLDSGHYLLSFESNGASLDYDSSEPKERFFGSPKELLTMGDSK